MTPFNKRGRGRTVRRVAGTMNRTEAAYALVLADRQQRGEVLWYKFEPITFRLGDDLRYTPDFVVQLADGTVELHECKGPFIEEHGKTKPKMCAEMYPFRVVLAQKIRNEPWAYTGWGFEEQE